MPFEKGHNTKGGRKKGSKSKQRLIRYHPKKWDTSARSNIYDMEEIEHRLNNNLPIDDIIDKLNNRYNPETRKPGNYKTRKNRKNND